MGAAAEFLNKGEDEAEFQLWAFGCQPRTFLQAMNAWNRLHSDLFVLRSKDNVASCLMKMIELWRKSLRNQEE